MNDARLTKIENGGFVDLSAVVRLQALQRCPSPPCDYNIVASLVSGESVVLERVLQTGTDVDWGLAGRVMAGWAARINGDAADRAVREVPESHAAD